MNNLQSSLTSWIRWAIVWIVGIVTFLTIFAWPEEVYPFQKGVTVAAESTLIRDLSDREIVHAIQKKAAMDGIETDGFQIFATRGIVTLDGSVSSLAEKDHVRQVAIGIRDVRGVIDQLNVSPSSLSDDQIQTAAREQLLANSATDAYDVAVSVEKGRVTLTGKVDSLAEKQLAGQVVSELRGVREIDNQMEIRNPENRSDRDIRAEIHERLANNVWIDEQMLKVDVDRGAVRFQGKVATADLKDRLKTLAITPGVQVISNDQVDVDPSLSIVPKKRRPSPQLDFEIRKALRQSLRLDPRVDLREIEINVDQGVVSLEGNVGDLQSRQAAIDTARHVVGVANIIDNLTIKSDLQVPDLTIKKRLLDSFDRIATLENSGIEVEVESGVVKLTGRVGSQYQRRRASTIAHSLTGVMEVNNEITIEKPNGNRSDFDIGLDIERAMRWSPYLDITKLKYRVDQGVVTFTGTVASQQSLEIARSIGIDSGARDIISTDVTIE